MEASGWDVMPFIYLMRHGMAEDRSLSGRDEDRALSQEGTAKLQRAAAGLAWLEIKLDAIIASPLLRARQTAEILRDTLAPSFELSLDPQLRPEADVDATLQGLRSSAGARTLIIGHEPSISALAAALLTGSAYGARLPFKPGSLAAIELDAIAPPERGSLRWFLTADKLGRLAR
jgi:phosphohistidine phosphatase